MTRHAWIALSLLALLFLRAPSRGAEPEDYEYGDVSPAEQYMLELVNRARADPPAEGERLGIDLTGYVARQPVTMNRHLLEAARSHVEDMSDDTPFFDHPNADGVNANGRVIDFGYVLHQDFTPQGETDIRNGNTVENIWAASGGPDAAHLAFLKSVDHRDNLLSKHSSKVDEAGIGLVLDGPDVIIDEKRYKDFCVQEFAYDPDFRSYVLGVAYRDANRNGFFDIGEELPGVTVATEDGAYSTLTAPGGGYGIVLDGPGDYALEASGGGIRRPVTIPFTLGGENVKVDFALSVFELIRSSFKVNFRKRPRDVLKLKAFVGASEDVQALEVSVELGDLALGPFPLTAKGRSGIYRSPKGAEPRVLVKLASRSGKLVVKVAKGDLGAGLGIAEETIREDVVRTLRVVVGDALDESLDVTFALQSKEGRKAAGRSR